MPLRDRLLGLLARGAAVEPAPDAIVELEEVWLHEGPRLVQLLQNGGIDARGVESTNVATEAAASNRMRIFVRYADVSRAAAVLEAHRRRLRDDD